MRSGDQVDGVDGLHQQLTPLLLPALALTALTGCTGVAEHHDVSTSAAAGDIRVVPLHSECGDLTTHDVAAVVHRPDLTLIGRTPVGCTWSPTGVWSNMPAVTLTWYRGSPLGRERKSEERFRQEVIDYAVDGKSGFMSSSYGLCVVAVEYATDQYFEVAVTESNNDYGTDSESCRAAVTLATRVAHEV